MKIIFISGDGHGAGKTYLANKFTNGQHQIFSVANAIRFELSQHYKGYNWYNKDPKYKDKTIVKETNQTLRSMLDKHGNEKKDKNKFYWAQIIVNLLEYSRDHDKLDTVVIDDLRFLDELNYIKSKFQAEHCCHLHVVNSKALPEPNYENEKLKKVADYLIYANTR